MLKHAEYERDKYVIYTKMPDGRNANRPWLNSQLRDRKHYIRVQLVRCPDKAKLPAAFEYFAKFVQEMFKSPIVNQATVYNTTVPLQTPGAPEIQVFVRYDAKNYEKITGEIKKLSADYFKANPMPEGCTNENVLYYVENHYLSKHEDKAMMTGYLEFMHDEDSGKGEKWMSYGYSKPTSKDEDPKQRVAYIDWYQEVRQHDVVRSGFCFDNARMWLLIESEKPFPCFVLTMYEWVTSDLKLETLTTGATYATLDRHRGHGGLYGPIWEGIGSIVLELIKDY